jgi:hypothetical protein
MTIKIYNRFNFYRHTFCVFEEVPFTTIEEKKADYKSKSGSSYYFTEEGVYRLSNHWGRAANCKWRLKVITSNPSRTKLGFANWNAFHSDNDIEKLYFITVDLESLIVNYQHKFSSEYQEKYVLRTASETTKIIKSIRDLLSNESWAKHFPNQDIKALRKEIIEKLMTTNQSLFEIKRALAGSL